MKKLFAFALIVVVLISPVLAGDNGVLTLPVETEQGFEDLQSLEHGQELMDCTFTIKGTFDGVKVDLQITVYDVSWLECGALKLGVKNALN
jgi:hypothetical protein